jgi:hypothetical protein
VALLQQIYPFLKAKLIKIAGIDWNTKNFSDPKRQQYHEHKMASKDTRPALQMKKLGLRSGTVIHELVSL